MLVQGDVRMHVHCAGELGEGSSPIDTIVHLLEILFTSSYYHNILSAETIDF